MIHNPVIVSGEPYIYLDEMCTSLDCFIKCGECVFWCLSVIAAMGHDHCFVFMRVPEFFD